MTGPGKGDDYLRCNGAGEMLVFSAADFEDFLEPRPDLAGSLETELKEVVSLLAANKWPFRLHATYDESITRFLNVFEEVNRDVPFTGLNWFFDHCETISDRNLERVKALGGGIAVQHRMAFQGEYFMERYGKQAAERTPPVRKMLELGIPVGAGTDATRVASYNPWVSLYWLTTGKTVGGVSMYPDQKLPEPRRGAATLHARQQLVFEREREERRDCSRPVGRLGGAHRRLFLRAGGTNQRHRIRVHRRGRKDCPRDGRVCPARTTADSRAAGMVARQSASVATARRSTCAKLPAPACRCRSIKHNAECHHGGCDHARASTARRHRSRPQSLRRLLRPGLRLLRVLNYRPLRSINRQLPAAMEWPQTDNISPYFRLICQKPHQGSLTT